jgi:hypothetical protein
MSRTKAVILILVGIGFGLLALVFAESGSLVYILWAVSICLGSRLIKSTIQELLRGRQRRGNFARVYRSELRCA